MTEVMTEVIVDCSTGEQTVRKLTAEEVAERKAAVEAFAAKQAAREAEAADKQMKREAILAALADAAGLEVTDVLDALS